MLERVRLPLQVGTSSLWSLARSSASLAPGLVLLGAGLSLVGSSPGWGVGLGLLGGYLLLYGGAHAVRAWRTRASDALLSAERLELEGGRWHGTALGWSELERAACQAETTREARITISKILADGLFLLFSTLLADKPELAPADRVPIRRLQLGTRDGRRFALAEAEHPEEQASLDALFGSLQSKLRTELAPSAPPRDARVLACHSCGSPLPPAPSETVTCPFCQATVAIPPELRAKLWAEREVAQSRRATAETIAKLLAQPGARRANVVLALAATACVATWLVVLLVALVTGITSLGAFEWGWLLTSGMVFSAAVFMLARLALVERGALRLLATSFGARPGRDAQHGPECRACGGPLPKSDTLVARCGYCDADNVLGLDLRSEVVPERAAAKDLGSVLTAREASRRSWLIGGLVALLLVAFTGTMAATSISLGLEIAEARHKCSAGKAAACTALGRKYDIGVGVSEDDAEAYELYRAGCKLGDAEGCYQQSEFLRWGWGTNADPQGARGYRTRACRLGYEEACKPADE